MNKGSIRFKPSANDPNVGRWYLDFRDGSPLIRCEEHANRGDRDLVDAWRNRYVAAMAKLGATVQKSAVETVSTWFDGWLAARKAKGLSSTKSDRGRFKKWIEPKIGDRPMAEVTKRELEGIVESLDRAVRESDARILKGEPGPTFRGKTARNVWAS